MKKRLPHIFFSSFLILLMLPVFGQTERFYSFDNYSNREGFDQNTVWAIEQDKHGMFWLGTANGLIKYDGFSFYDISWDPEYQSEIYGERIVDILNDQQDLLWILSGNSLNIFNPSQEDFFKISNDSTPHLSGLIEDEKGSVWVYGHGFIATANVGISNDTIISQWSQNLMPEELTDLRINDLLNVNENLYLLATSQGVYKMLSPGSETGPVFEFDSLFSEIRVSRLLKHNDLIWIGTASGLHKTVMDGEKLRYLNTYTHNHADPASIGGNDIRDLLIGPDNNLWIGTWGGGLSLFNFEDELFTNFLFDPRKKEGVSSSMINCIYSDQFNVLWIGTAQGGLSKLDLTRKQFTNFEHNPYEDSSIPGNLINCILEDSEGYLWISTYHNPLCRSQTPITGNKITNLSFNRFNSWFNHFPGKNILSIFEDKLGLIWLGYENAVVVYNPVDDTFTEIDFDLQGIYPPGESANFNFIGAIDQEKIMIAGKRIIILDNPWQYLNSDNIVKVPVYANSSFDNTRVITAELKGPDNIWIALRKQGLSRYSLIGDSLVLKSRMQYSRDNERSISNNSIFSILEDSEKRLWIGTFGGGLNRMKVEPDQETGEFDRLKDTLDLRDNVIYGIIEQNDSILWLSTDQGICKLNSRTLQSIRFNMADGVASNNFRKNAYHQGRSGYYYFGGLYGLTVFKPDQIKPNLIPPEIILSALRINNNNIVPGDLINKKYMLEKPVSEISDLVLTQADRILALDVIVMHTATPERNHFAYKLEGFDVEWMEIKHGSYTLNYNNLPSGKYRLRIKGFNGDGIMSANETSLNITMLSPWYAKPWSITLFILFGLSIILGVAIYIIKLKNLQNSLHYEKIDKERIKEINQAKLRFFTNISHEFRTPLALISIPLQKLQELVKDSEQKKYLTAAEKNTGKLIRLIDQLLTFRRIEHGKLELKHIRTSMDDFLYPIAEAFEALSNKKEIEFYYLVKDPELSFAIDLEKMEQVLYNLLSNAFKFTPPGGRITLEGKSCIFKDSQHVCFEIKDTGKGIQKREMGKIFDRFYQTDSEIKNMGTGIGLSYSRSIVELHNGIIHVDSTPGTGTTFSVMIPFIDSSPTEENENEVLRIDPHEFIEFEELAASIGSVKKEDSKKEGTILIADDEADFRVAIKDIFSKNFRILEASDGKDALDITRKENPDLIISDVMMPVMDGYDFCKHVKTDVAFCHVPFILLTALEEMENHIQGTEYGADAYITKPFNLKYLEAKVQSLIENRNKIQEHFIQNHSLPKNIKIPGIDREFIESVNEAIRQNLHDSSFGVEELAKTINLSSSHFYRKLKLLTGQIPNVYIRNYRLQTAADLISTNPGISVKTVMYEVGFESASHFSHAFKKKFGLSPSEF
ncbi:MAG: two-component regulator propeller domain-containing protein [Bacteroides sp.]|nr:two-component regulator propeller domain-containing protein [Bacteroides sp.]